MFGMGFSEILMILIVAIIFLGPEKLPTFLVDAAKFFKSVKRAINDAKSSIEDEIKLSELKEEAQNYKEKLSSIDNDIKNAVHIDELEEVIKMEDSLKKEANKENTATKDLENKDKIDV